MKRPSPAMIVALIALFVALGGSAYAVGTINGGSLVDRSVPGKKLKLNTVSGKEIAESSLARVPRAAVADKLRVGMWAVVRADGTKARAGNGVVSTQNLGVDGEYQVVFTRDVTKCSYVGTIGGHNSSTSGFVGVVGVSPADANAKAVFVQTYNVADGLEANLPFHLAVFC